MMIINSIFKLLIAIGLIFLMGGCVSPRLDVQTQYLSHEHLASYHVNTPDPCLNKSLIGQRLLVQWSLCAREVVNDSLFLHLRVRFRNYQEKEVQIPIKRRRGYYLYVLANEEYCQSRGILTYYAEIRNETETLATWKHPLWAELIKFNFTNPKK